VLLVQVHDLQGSQPELALTLVAEVADAEEIQTFTPQPLSPSAQKRIMLHQCPSEWWYINWYLVYHDSFARHETWLGWVKVNVWKDEMIILILGVDCWTTTAHAECDCYFRI
jgi:hypothetical protein